MNIDYSVIENFVLGQFSSDQFRNDNFMSRLLTIITNILYMIFPQGRFTIAAKHHITIAEIYESEKVDVQKVSLFKYLACLKHISS